MWNRFRGATATQENRRTEQSFGLLRKDRIRQGTRTAPLWIRFGEPGQPGSPFSWHNPEHRQWVKESDPAFLRCLARFVREVEHVAVERGYRGLHGGVLGFLSDMTGLSRAELLLAIS